MTLETIIILVVVIVLFVTTYVLNKRIPKPDGCEISDKCGNCKNINCYVKKNKIEGDNNERQ